MKPIFNRGRFGYRPKRSAHEAIQRVSVAIVQGKTEVLDLDLRSYFDTIRHDVVLAKVARRINDPDVVRLLKLILKASGQRGVAQGGVISPLISNLYLNEVDQMLERAKEVTRHQGWTTVEYARFADDLVVLVDGFPRHRGVRVAVEKRLREELAKLGVDINEEKTRTVDLTQGQSFDFLGFRFRWIRSRKGHWMALRMPRMEKRTALLRQLKAIFRRYRSQPVERVIEKINPILRGWVNYFAVGHSNDCCS